MIRRKKLSFHLNQVLPCKEFVSIGRRSLVNVQCRFKVRMAMINSDAGLVLHQSKSTLGTDIQRVIHFLAAEHQSSCSCPGAKPRC